VNKYKKYIFGQLGRIERDCVERGITANEWIEKHAAEYCRKHWDDNVQSNASCKSEPRKSIPPGPLARMGQ